MQSTSENSPTISGRKLVVLMFVFGGLATTTLWAYWNLHMMPFMPLQEALVAEYGKDSAPRVEGGQRKMHKQTTRMLRVILRVPFNPLSEESDIQAKVAAFPVKVRDIASEHVDLAEYDTLELHLFQDVQEDIFPQITIRKNIRDWQDVNEDGTPLSADHVPQM